MLRGIKNFVTKNWRQNLPETLFGRSLLLLVIPLTLVQIVSIFIFFDRHWQSVLRQIADNCAAHVQAGLLLLEEKTSTLSDGEAISFIKTHFDIDIEKKSPQKLSLSNNNTRDIILSNDNKGFTEEVFEEALKSHLAHPFTFEVEEKSLIVQAKKASGETITFIIPRKKMAIKAIRLYLAWSLGMSIILLIIAAIFLRNQLRPLQRLAEAVQHFGKGQKVDSFRPAGTKEIRKVGTAFIVMRDRLQRYILQRTQMLAGVSHDLRTPLTRMKLQLALLPQQAGIESLKQDIQEMEKLIKGYLDFAQTEHTESFKKISLIPFLKKIVNKFSAEEKKRIQFPLTNTVLHLNVKPHSLERCINNVLSNALRYGKYHVEILLEKRKRTIAIIVDDDGPGIPVHQRKNVLKPFYRLEGSRNKTTGGIGLGLSVVQDSIRSQGGHIILSSSPWGGLRLQLILPV